ncbi:MAG: NOP5/NOP56 family protein [Candidatus Woesearchaeota archaeon]|nr:NOP5/NOP56 family protein [Candidatus Woesearchaeota archaeon]
MASLFLYSNSMGTFVFNQNFFLIDKVFLNEKDIIKNADLLSKGKFTEQEKKMISKHKKGQFSFIGFKTEEFSDVKSEIDMKKLERVYSALDKKDILADLRKADTLITKEGIRKAVNTDVFVVQAVNNVMEMEKISNTMAKRLREWYSYYLPEFSESISDHEKFAEIVVAKTREEILKEIRLKKEDSMGGEVSGNDLKPIILLAKELNDIYKFKEIQSKYVDKIMENYCPNISAVAGPLIGAKLLEKAGSLKRLSEFPSSTVQVLGAEEAFFRHMTTGSRPPKHGFIHEHPFVAQASKDEKGRIARVLADKISIAAKVDYCKGEFIGDKLRKQVEAKLKSGRKDKRKFVKKERRERR